MSSTGKTIVKNASVMMVSQIITWSLSFILAVFLPRYLGASIIGEMSIAYSIWAIVSVIVTFGMDTHLTKTVARDSEQIEDILGTSIFLRVVFFLVSCVFVSIYVYVNHITGQTVYIIALVACSTLLSLLVSALSATVSGLERMDINALSGTVSKVFSTCITLFLIFIKANLYIILSVNILAGIVSTFIIGFFLIRQHYLVLRIHFNRMIEIVRVSFPYLVTALSIVVYQQVDNLFIAALVDTSTVGWYSIATGLFSTMMFVPVLFGTVLFPALSRAYTKANDHFTIIARRSIDLMFLTSIPIGMGIIVISNPIVELLYGPEFVQSGPVLGILGAVMVFTYLNTLLGHLLISTDATNKWNGFIIGGIILTFPLDFVLVPWTRDAFGNGALGGALAYLVTELGMVIGAIWLLPKGTLQWSNVRTAILSLVAGVIMTAASWWWRNTMLPVSIIVGAVTYIGLVFLLRIVPQDDLLLLKDLAMQILDKFRRTKKISA